MARRRGSVALATDEGMPDLPSLVRQMVRAVLRGVLTAAQVAETLGDAELQALPGLRVMVADIFALTDAELQGSGDSELQPKLLHLVKECLRKCVRLVRCCRLMAPVLCCHQRLCRKMCSWSGWMPPCSASSR